MGSWSLRAGCAWLLIVCAWQQSAMAAAPGHQHDFDFEFGSWTAHVKRLAHPLTGSHTWIDYSGTSVVRKIWNGKANLGELEIGNLQTHIQALSFRLYDPQSAQWNVYFANSRVGILGVPMVGAFNNGRGMFYDTETYNGKPIRVRFVFSDITPRFFRLVQSFSPDGGKSWESNWIATFSRS
jgi:hypothetical protein